MEGPPTSKRAAAHGCDNVGDRVRNGVGVDGQREYQPVCEGAT